jgi:hypothetical protein
MSKSLPEERWRFAVPGGGKTAVEARREARLRLIEEGLSRRRFLHVSAGATGLVLAGGAWSPGFAATCEPKPIPHGFDPDGPDGILPFIHLLLPGLVHAADTDPSTITDFNGQVGYAVIDGTGTRTDLATSEVTENPFEVDLRFMKGTFVGADGRHCHGAFALI